MSDLLRGLGFGLNGLGLPARQTHNAPYGGHLGRLQNYQLNLPQQATLEQQRALFHAQMQQPNLLAPYYEHQAQLERERFFRSCSQHWLDAMLDIELGLHESG